MEGFEVDTQPGNATSAAPYRGPDSQVVERDAGETSRAVEGCRMALAELEQAIEHLGADLSAVRSFHEQPRKGEELLSEPFATELGGSVGSIRDRIVAARMAIDEIRHSVSI